MNNRKNYTLLIVAALFIMLSSGCRSMLIKKYSIGRSFEFNSRKAFYNYLIEEKLFDTATLIFPDSASMAPFIFYKVMPDSAVVYLGTYMNDSMQLLKSIGIQDNNSCKGRIQGEIEGHLQGNHFPDSLLQRTSSMAAFRFFSISNQQPFNIPSTKRVRVYLLYSYQMGTYYHQFYKDLQAIGKKYAAKADMYVICLDPVFQLSYE